MKFRIPNDEGRKLKPEPNHRAFGFRASEFWFRIFVTVIRFLAPPLYAATNTSSSDELPVLRPPHPEIPPTFWEQNRTLAVALGVLLSILACGLVWWVRRARQAVVVPPEVQARRALDELKNKAEDGAVLSRISQVLRRYFAAAFWLPQ